MARRVVAVGRVTFDGLIMTVVFDDDPTNPLDLDLGEGGTMRGGLPNDGDRVRVVITEKNDGGIDVFMEPEPAT